MLKIALFFFLLFSIVESSIALNPFDLTHRLNYLQQRNKNLSLQGNKVLNPFDIRGERIPQKTKLNPILIKKADISLKFTSKKVPATPLFWFFLVILAVVTLVITTSRGLFGKMSNSLSNDIGMRNLLRDAQNIYSTPIFLLYLLWCIGITFFLAIGLYYYEILPAHPLRTFYQILPWTLLLLGVKVFIWRSVSVVFMVQKQFNVHLLESTIISIYTGLLLVLLCAGMVYGPIQLVQSLFWIGLVLLGFHLIAKVILCFQNGRSFSFDVILHYLLYLCSVEIAPLVIVLTYLLRQLSLV